jgi:hypothetical protein
VCLLAACPLSPLKARDFRRFKVICLLAGPPPALSLSPSCHRVATSWTPQHRTPRSLIRSLGKPTRAVIRFSRQTALHLPELSKATPRCWASRDRKRQSPWTLLLGCSSVCSSRDLDPRRQDPSCTAATVFFGVGCPWVAGKSILLHPISPWASLPIRPGSFVQNTSVMCELYMQACSR